MRRFIFILILMIISSSAVFASKIPEELQSYIQTSFPGTDFRFDGVIILPDTTLYLPLFPAKPAEVEEIQIKSTIPEGKSLAQKPEIVIFNNEYVLLKVINDKDGKKTVLSPTIIPNEIRSGLLPQDMLVPRGLMIPESLKGIIGNLDISMAESPGIKAEVPKPRNPGAQNSVIPVEQLKDKTFYIITGYSKNIQVVNSENKYPAYALAQSHVPNSIKGYDNKYLLVTSFGSRVLNVISLADEDIIKEIFFNTQPDEIIIKGNIAYVSSAENSSIYVVDLETMTLSKQIKINGMCEKLTLSDDGTRMFYVDKKANGIWAIELDNNYLLKDIGKFPNVSKIAYTNGKIYITSRTKGHLAIVDYETNDFIAELPVTAKPVDMAAFEDNLFILGAGEDIIQIVDTETDEITGTIYLNTKGFPTNITPIDGTSLAIISDSRASIYCVLDMASKQIVKASAIEVPIRSIVVMDRVKKINK